MAKVNFDTSKKLDITCRRGDSFSLELTLKDSSGNLLNLHNDSFNFLVMQSWQHLHHLDLYYPC